MKKQFFTLALMLLCISTGAFAQYQKGNIMVNAGVSFGLIGYNWGAYGSSSGFLPITANAEYSLNEMFSVGPYLGYYGRTYKSGGYKDRFTAIAFGARGTFHATGLLNDQLGWSLDEEKWDLYGSLMLGYETYSWKFDESNLGEKYYSGSSSIELAPVVGARYHITPAFGTFLELGHGSFGYITVGGSARF